MIVIGEVYQVKEWLSDNELDEEGLYEDVTEDWYEYEVTLWDDKKGEMIDEWNSLTQTYNGVQRLTEEEAEEALKDVLRECNEEGNYRDWFDV